MNVADITKLLFFVSIFVWLIPPFKQYKGKYFLFFLILSCIDPINLLFLFIIKTAYQPQIMLIINYLLLLSLINFILLKKYWPWVILVSILLLSPTIFKFDSSKIVIIYILLNSGIALIILKSLITSFVTVEKLNLFLTIFLIYQLTVIAKFSNLILGFADAVAFFILTSIAQIIFGLFFSVYREDKSGKSI